MIGLPLFNGIVCTNVASCTQCILLPAFRYGTLLELGEKRKDMLEKSCKKFMLFREANELQQWIHEKESALTNEEVGSDLEQVEVLQKKFDDFQKVLFVSLSEPLNFSRTHWPFLLVSKSIWCLFFFLGPESK